MGGAREGLHIGVVGVGRIGAFHATTLAGLDAVSALTIVDADPARAAEVAAGLDADVVAEPADLVSAGVDALVIAAPTSAHAALLRLAAEAGLPAFCEKPVALDVPAV